MPPERTSGPDNTLGAKNFPSDVGSGLGEKLADASSQIKSKASDLARSTADKIDSNRDAAAGGLESAANKLHDKADSLPGGKRVSSAAHTAANTLSSTADYIREHDVSSMMTDVYELVKKNPGPALLGAACLGFLVARSFSKE